MYKVKDGQLVLNKENKVVGTIERKQIIIYKPLTKGLIGKIKAIFGMEPEEEIFEDEEEFRDFVRDF